VARTSQAHLARIALQRSEAFDHIMIAAASDALVPSQREVARRLDDLAQEVTALRGGDAPDARFALLGHRANPERRVMLAGRSSAAFIADPSWDALSLVRLAPSDGPSMSNSAHHRLDEVIALVRQGQWGQGRTVPADVPAPAAPDVMLELLREDTGARDRGLAALAEEVREGHAVDVPRRARRRRVDVGVGVDMHQSDLAVLLVQGTQDRQGDGVVATQGQRLDAEFDDLVDAKEVRRSGQFPGIGVDGRVDARARRVEPVIGDPQQYDASATVRHQAKGTATEQRRVIRMRRDHQYGLARPGQTVVVGWWRLAHGFATLAAHAYCI
jgi:hypothetical protein